MPTYTYSCLRCDDACEVVESISRHVSAPLIPACCGVPMERRITVAPGFSGFANALAGDRHYDGLRATDGTDISSRSKHREYMRRKGLTTIDDFSGQWARAEKQREQRRSTNVVDPVEAREIRQVIADSINSPNLRKAI